MTDKRITRLAARYSYLSGHEVEDGFWLDLDFGADFAARVVVDTNSYIPLPRWVLYGTHGSAVIEDWDCRGKVIVHRDSEEELRGIIAGNGMCTGGRIKHHLLHNLERPGATVLFVGYQAPGTLGRLLSDGAKEIRLFNKRIPVKAAVRQVNGLSGHADQNELLRWAGGIKAPPQRCFVTHGDPPSATTLAEKLGEKYGWKIETPSLFQKTAFTERKFFFPADQYQFFEHIAHIKKRRAF